MEWKKTLYIRLSNLIILELMLWKKVIKQLKVQLFWLTTSQTGFLQARLKKTKVMLTKSLVSFHPVPTCVLTYWLSSSFSLPSHSKSLLPDFVAYRIENVNVCPVSMLSGVISTQSQYILLSKIFFPVWFLQYWLYLPYWAIYTQLTSISSLFLKTSYKKATSKELWHNWKHFPFIYFIHTSI